MEEVTTSNVALVHLCEMMTGILFGFVLRLSLFACYEVTVRTHFQCSLRKQKHFL